MDNVNPNKNFYIIRRYPPGAGFFSNFLYALGHMVVADEQGLTPVVDMQNYPTFYNEAHPIHGTFNAWEYYFKPVDNLDINTAYQTQNFVFSDYQYKFDKVPAYGIGHNELPSKESIETLNKYINKYIILQPDIIDTVNQFYEQFKIYKKVLGIHMRGTDMNYFPEHPKQPGIETMLLDVERIINDYNIDGLFVCTDEQANINIFKERFPGKVIESSAFRATETTHTGIYINNVDTRENHRYLLGKEVLVDMLLLSKCNILLCGPSNVPYVATLFNNNQYEATFLIQ